MKTSCKLQRHILNTEPKNFYDMEDLRMRLKPIKNNRGYQKALREIDRLMDAQLNSPEGGRLDVFATLAETWEEKRWHIDAPEPVETNGYPKSRPSVSDW